MKIEGVQDTEYKGTETWEREKATLCYNTADVTRIYKIQQLKSAKEAT
jgi:hypothetical protein